VCLPFYCKTDSSSVLAEVMVEGVDSVTVGSYESGRVTSDSGVSITIPTLAVPLMEDGSAGEMVFGASTVDMEVNLPAEHSSIGPVYQLQPEGFRFDQPVSVSFPIPAYVDPADVQGAAYYDAAADGWVMNPVIIDADARTATVETTHFSYWTLWSALPTFLDYVNLQLDTITTGRFSSYLFETDNAGLPTKIVYGMCLRPVTEDSNWTGMRGPANGWTSLAVNNINLNWSEGRVRPGTYEVIEYYTQAELPMSPIDRPHSWIRWNTRG
jgi:hypothetical protein